MRYKIKRQYKGLVSVRDYIIDKCIKNNEPLIIEFEGQQMTVSLSSLKSKFQLHNKKFRSKYSEKTYELIDFVFEPDPTHTTLF